MYKISNIKLPIGFNESDVVRACSKECGAKISGYKILKQSIDARRKPIKYVLTLAVATEKKLNLPVYENIDYSISSLVNSIKCESTAVVIGSGPCGLFAALTLAEAGVKVTVLERGEEVEKRRKSVLKFETTGYLNTESNIQFGEGGAGTFSDGKLNTGINSLYIPYVLREFTAHGAPADIEYAARPHIGTDVLSGVVKSMRDKLISLGADIRFSTRADALIVDNGKCVGVTAKGREFYADCVILATGHSARDTYKMLYKHGVIMESKPFAVGARIEHDQEIINTAQYGIDYDKRLPAAEYKLSHRTQSGRGCFTFCMCPGGVVTAAASEIGGVVSNGMSNHARDGLKANSAVLAGVTPEDFGGSLFGGVDFQRRIEESAYNVGTGYSAPCMTTRDFINSVCASNIDKYNPTYPRGVTRCNLAKILPEYIINDMREGIRAFDNKLRGFNGGLLIGVETRSSSPIRIVRDSETHESNIANLYPCGEGAGYAGGITSSAIDGIKTAIKILQKINSTKL